MSLILKRRRFLLAAATLPFASFAGATQKTVSSDSRLAALEATLDGARLGVYALDTGSGKELRHRADERFPVCSTFKLLLAAAILKQSASQTGLLEQKIRYAPGDLVSYSPVTEKHTADGMSVAELCAAALQYSDNTAGNLLLKILGGPPALTAFARAIGDRKFRLDRWETVLNTAIPGDVRDSSTPAAMGQSLKRTVLGNVLPEAQRSQLQDWLRGNTTGAARIQAGIPGDWKIGDKTGSGDYGTTNDVAVLWPPAGKPLVLAVYLTQKTRDAPWRSEVLAEVARIVVGSLR